VRIIIDDPPAPIKLKMATLQQQIAQLSSGALHPGFSS
jgi:hypothetical protein